MTLFRRQRATAPPVAAWWAEPIEELLRQLGSSAAGLTSEEAEKQRLLAGAKGSQGAAPWRPLALFLRQLSSPLVLILVVAAILAASLGELIDAAAIVVIVGGSVLLSFVREYAAERTLERLRDRLSMRVGVMRDGRLREIPAAEVVPGDVFELAAGTLVPADGRLLEATDLFVSEAALTGETFPVEKKVASSAADSVLAQRIGAVFQGTSVRSGMGRAVVAATGDATAYGRIAASLLGRAPETEFARGIRRFGYLLTRIVLVLVLVVFAANVFAAKPPLDSLLFAMALAVGISPELLPAIVAVNLTRGARKMAEGGVIVRQLEAIENLGSMDLLCMDKTGTLTVGVVRLEGAFDPAGRASAQVLRSAFLNAELEAGLPNPLDEALRAAGRAANLALGAAQKRGEVPYDFIRKRLSVAVEEEGRLRLLTKGAFDAVLAVCDRVAAEGGSLALDAARREELAARFAAWSADGQRVLGVAERPLGAAAEIGRAAEEGMIFQGFLLFSDPPKPGVAATVAALRGLGVELKILTGDNRQVASYVARQVGLSPDGLLTGAELDRISADALPLRIAAVELFAELDPDHKERLLRAWQKSGRVVGFLGDGINDAPALHAADVGISVETATDVAKQAAKLVLLSPDLEVLLRGIEEGRQTFANTMKYLFTTSSANFGNMISMAAASVALPFLPLLAKQILLNNFLSDLPGLAIAGDANDPEQLARPQRWDLPRIRDFMVVFGLLSSVFDGLVFALLLWLAASPELFRTGWFVASLLTELAVVFVLRTRRPFFRSRPGRLLLGSSVAVAALALVLPYVGEPLSGYLGFVPLPAPVLVLMVALTVLYAMAAEATKMAFYRWRP